MLLMLLLSKLSVLQHGVISCFLTRVVGIRMSFSGSVMWTSLFNVLIVGEASLKCETGHWFGFQSSFHYR
ncbi:hypothetical protein QVD17_05372 [Tagetes erecta]|uniref:Uncharacterized protein n=1 Tax=Tagetes erecta TaxID=13708 RepID=A0AAD8LDP4_TARER|nr:hypothetical protein QVD17_05372 [Tagetes erecta]